MLAGPIAVIATSQWYRAESVERLTDENGLSLQMTPPQGVCMGGCESRHTFSCVSTCTGPLTHTHEHTHTHTHTTHTKPLAAAWAEGSVVLLFGGTLAPSGTYRVTDAEGKLVLRLVQADQDVDQERAVSACVSVCVCVCVYVCVCVCGL